MNALRWLLVAAAVTAASTIRSAEPFELKDGDRVVLLGGTLIEREQRYGSWESALTARHPDRNITFRNLGWSGDTVFGHARAVFGSVNDGFKAMKEQLAATKPTVVLINYGANEAFDGEAGLVGFQKQLDALLDAVVATKARVAIVTPPRLEDLGRPLPDPADANKKIGVYRDALLQTAAKRGLPVIDLYDLIDNTAKPPLTDNGMHLTESGYRRTAAALEKGLGWKPIPWRVEIDAEKKTLAPQGTALTPGTQLNAGKGLLSFWLQDEVLPANDQPRVLKVRGLPAGPHTLVIDDKAVVTATSAEWAEGVAVTKGPDHDQAEKLRATILAKNELFFHRWRPANETYLFLFRKGEQGQNAREIPVFDPMVADQDRAIARLRVPLPHMYEFIPASPLPGVPNTDPEEERKSFVVADGFEVSLFAADPLLAKPVQMNFDPQGRLWVASSETYPQIKPGQTANDKVLILEDTKGAGKADKITVFADGLLIPTGLEPGDGGVYVGNSTDLLHLSDTDSDGKADKRRIVLSGFGTEDTHHIIHTFRWGHDGLLYFNQSIYIHSHVETPHGPRHLNAGGIWQFRPESLKLEVFARGWVNTWGHHVTRWGQSLATDGAGGEGINFVVPEASYTTAVGASRVVQGLNPGSPKYCGLEVVSGRHLPDDWQGNLITNDFRGHRVCRFVLKEDGSGFAAQQMADVIKSNHPAFRPIDVKMGPDGAIYIADWYNPIINHGEVDFRDPRRDHTHGRIWRVTAKNRPLVPKPAIVEAKTADLLELLKAPEDWTRQQAKRILKERGVKILPDLAKWVAGLNPTEADHEHRLLEALWVYQALDTVEPTLLKTLLQRGDHHARAAAVRVVPHWSARVPESLALLAVAASDEHPQVRLEAVCALRKFSQERAIEIAMTALDRPMDKFLDYALWQTARELQPTWLPALQKGSLTFGGNVRHLLFALQSINSTQTVQTLLTLVKDGKVQKDQEDNVLELVAGLGGPEELSYIFSRTLNLGETPARQARLLAALEKAARERKAKPARDLGSISEFLNSPSEPLRANSSRLAGLWGQEWLQGKMAESVRASLNNPTLLQATVEGLVLMGGQANKVFFTKLATEGETPRLKMIGTAALTAFDVPAAATAAVTVLGQWPMNEDPSDLFIAFADRKGGASALAKALADKKVPEDVAKIGIRTVRASGRDAPDLVEALTKAGGLKGGPKVLTPADLQQLIADVNQRGNPARGEAVFRRKDQTCMKCHAVAGAGGQVGPGLESFGAGAPLDYIIEALLQPNKAVKEGYHASTVSTLDGRVFTGIKVRETKTELVLRTADDKELGLNPTMIDEAKPAGSLMPEGLTDTLTRDELIDLVRFLAELGKVGPYAVGKSQLVRTWQVLEPSQAAKQALSKNDFAPVTGNDPTLTWASAYGTVAGVLPLEAVPPLATDSKSMGIVRCRLEATTPGKVKLLLNDGAGLTLWLDGSPVDVKTEMEIDVPAGVHNLTFAVDSKARKEGLRVELDEVAGSGARVRFLGGK